MTRRPVTWWWSLPGDPDQLVLRGGVAIRIGVILVLALAQPLSWSHLLYPGWSILLALGLAAQNVAVCAWWLRRGRLDPWSLALDLPVGAVAILATAYLTDTAHGWTGYVLWTGYGYPYTVVLSVTLGQVLRRLWTVLLAALVWALTEVTVAVTVDGYRLVATVFVVAPYLLMASAGWINVWLFRLGAAQLEAARAQAAEHAAQLAREQERTRHAQALHDRVLQTLETLARDRVVADGELHQRLVTEAAWLRRFVENGELDQSADLPAELAAAVRVVAGGGVPVQLNDAALRAWAPEPLPDRNREALVHATCQALAGLAQHAQSAVVRAEPRRGGVLVTILALGPAAAPHPADLDRARAHLAEVDGEFTVEPVPYAELWVPGGAQPEPGFGVGEHPPRHPGGATFMD
ncbi:MAG TPA: hypothetical protein VJT31_35660 [Rugosimonospora sp.]|nr:hypothetical protein [Rugosimonospora sp.]